jgi:hypothetical protein
VAVTGSTISPPIDLTVEMIGRGRTLSRIDAALAGSSSAAVDTPA